MAAAVVHHEHLEELVGFVEWKTLAFREPQQRMLQAAEAVL